MSQELSSEASLDQHIASIVDSLFENDDRSVEEIFALAPSLITTKSTYTMTIAADAELFDSSYPPPLSRISLSTEKPSDCPSLQPYAVYFYCSCCFKGYHSIVYSNPWYSIHRQSCPHCRKEQIPMLDINLPINARELDPNMEFYYNEMTDEEFLPGFVEIIDNCEEFSLELLCEPMLRLVFAESFYPSSVASSLQKLIDLPLLSLLIHGLRCSKSPALAASLHINPKHGSLCRNVQVLLLHMIGCLKSSNCLFPFCSNARPILSYLSTFPSEGVLGTAAASEPNPCNCEIANQNERSIVKMEQDTGPRRKKIKIEETPLLVQNGTGRYNNTFIPSSCCRKQERSGREGVRQDSRACCSFMRCIDDDIISFCQESSSSSPSSTFSFLPSASKTMA
jgi:hypothetical protein